MEAAQLPAVDQSGRFSVVLDRRPDDWPWVTPSYVALNVWSTPGRMVTRARATTRGATEVHEAFQTDLESYELIERWHGRWARAEVSAPMPADVLASEANRMLAELPIRFFTRAGCVLQESPDVQVFDDWPNLIQIRSIRDLGVVSALVFETAVSHGAEESAVSFRDRLHATNPGTEMLEMYREALIFAAASLRPALDERSERALDDALRAVRAALHG